MTKKNDSKFSTLNLSNSLLQAVYDKGYKFLTPIQKRAIPVILDGHDVMAAAQTGTGKTAGFTLPLLEMLSTGPKARANQTRSLILTPTRELAAQVENSVADYSKNLPIKYTVVFGGVKINPQMMKLRSGVDILVATPGRLLDLYQQNAVKFQQLQVLILDEADRMLDMGFIHDIRKIISLLPQKRQNLMFSATFTQEIRQLAKTIVNNPIEISVTPPNTTATAVQQYIYPVDKKQKTRLLIHLIKKYNWHQALVFTRTKHMANRLSRYLENEGIKSLPIHGNKSQAARTRALTQFKENNIQILVATDIAARGLDISQLPYVINFELPNVATDYIHRIGRTGRAGSNGLAVSLVCADEFNDLSDIENLIQNCLKREIIDGFEPVHQLPKSRLLTKKPKKVKKPKKSHHDGQRSGDIARGHQPVQNKRPHQARKRSASKHKNYKKNIRKTINQG